MKRVLKFAVIVSLAMIAWLTYRQIPSSMRAEWRAGLQREVTERLRGLRDRDSAGEGTTQEERAAGDEESAPSRVQKVRGLNAVRLSLEEQQQTGVGVQILERRSHLSESPASGKVLDIRPLVDLRAAYYAALGEQEIARTSIATSARAVERLRVLHREEANVSTRQLQEAESQAASDRARLSAIERRLLDIRNQALQQWGEALVSMVLAEDAQQFDKLVKHQDVLVLVTLSPTEELPTDVSFVFVGATGERSRARKAHLVSPAAQTDTVSQGETYFFRTNGERLRVGMRMDVWIPQARVPREGVEVPGSAVIWYADKLWVYVQEGADLFVRLPLAAYEETGDGWFVTTGLAPGDSVVVSGAQMLFSEEFRSNIPSEDEARE